MKRQNEKGGRHRIVTAAVLLIVSAALMVISARFPLFSEWYSQTIYPVLVSVVGRIMGILPFSAAEFGLYILAGAFLFSVVRLIRRTGTAGGIYIWFSKVILAVAVLAFLYTAGCGINYHRKSFSEEEGIIVSKYSAQDLEDICRWLTEEVNKRADAVERDKEGVMALSAPEGGEAVKAMERLGEQFPALKGYYPLPKKVTVSEILSYQGLTGVYSPFTVEANYNGDMTPYNVPFTVCHELSHLRGFMQEEEANFIAFLACIRSGNVEFEYSGYLSGWIYCMNALYRTAPGRWQTTRELLDSKVEADLRANNVFWQSYEGVVSEAADKVNDTYLKVNGQADGVQSYDRMVDLIAAYFTEDL